MARTTRRPGNLPAESTSFVGRRHELAELRKKLASTRLVSLVGPGGVGKSRLALRAATDLARGFTGGAWLVELAEVREPELVTTAVLTALDMRAQAATGPRAVLLSFLAEKELLLVVDNCEHLLEAIALLLADVIELAPRVRIIATSREPLSISGEHVLPVPPLELPPSAGGAEPLQQLRQNEAVLLFTERAAAASGEFELTEANRAAVVGLCRRLDGLPLAIELAAVRTRVLSPSQILDRLGDRFALLTAGSRAALPRHQTLRTTVDWSYELLTEDEKRLFRSVCVFAGRFTLEDVEGVCGPGALVSLASLVDKSLVVKEDSRAVAGYRLHETMREYAALRLREAGEEDAVQEALTAHFHLRLLGTGFEARYRLAEWLEWMELEVDNVRAVLRRCVDREDFGRGVEIATSAAWYWITRAGPEGVRWLDQLLDAGEGNPFSLPWAYFIRGFLSVLQSDPGAAREPLAQAAARGREARMPAVVSQALALASICESMSGDRAAADRVFEDAREAAAGVDADPQVKLSLIQARCLNGLFTGDPAGVAAAAAEGVRLSRATNDTYGLEMMLMNHAYASLVEGDVEGAQPLFAQALGIAQRIDDRIAEYALLYALALLAAAGAQARLAAQLLGAAESVCLSAGARVIGFLPTLLANAEASAVSTLGRQKFDAEFSAGKAMSRAAAIALALGESSRATALSRDGQGMLGKREHEVAQLIAEGLSNKQIGARLFISERTVATHVGSILNKLGFNSRAQIAAWMATPER